MSNPLTTIRDWVEDVHVAEGSEPKEPVLAALRSVESLVEACLNAQEGYELGSDPDVYAALQPFITEEGSAPG